MMTSSLSRYCVLGFKLPYSYFTIWRVLNHGQKTGNIESNGKLLSLIFINVFGKIKFSKKEFENDKSI